MARASRRQGAFPRADARGAPESAGLLQTPTEPLIYDGDLGFWRAVFAAPLLQSGALPQLFRAAIGPALRLSPGDISKHTHRIHRLRWPPAYPIPELRGLEISNMFG